ncbi:MAG: hypothetical protein WD448_02235 [Woeseia sp.]
MLAAAWPSTPVFAAANEQLSGDMQSLVNFDDRPVVDLVDLSDVDNSLDAADPATGQPDSLMLFLAPRVVNILEDVFRDSKIAAADDASDTESRWQGQGEKDSSSPLAGNTDSPDQADAEPDSAMYETDPILPRLQRQMYRTDI